MKVIHVTSEFAPIAKVGGIGDVILGLTRATLAYGIDTEVVLPFYSQIDLDLLPGLKAGESFDFKYGERTLTCKYFRATHGGVPLTLLDIEAPSNPFRRASIYGESDDSARFSLFTKAASGYLETQVFTHLHLHDWHSCCLPYCLSKRLPTILSLHNLAYLGFTSAPNLTALDIPQEACRLGEDFSLLKGGIECADALVAVSPTYAKEILVETPEAPLSSCLNQHRDKVVGILNGIDYTFWDPQKDLYLNHSFSSENLEQKTKLKQELFDSLGLTNSENPFVTAIARLVPQKGPELILAAFEKALQKGCSCLLLAASQDEQARLPFLELKQKWPHQFYLDFTFNEKLSHLAFGASDITLVPSHFEPCGLTQMIAMRYGSLPLVRATGGLKDSVTPDKGFIFEEATPRALINCLDQALEVWESAPDVWKKMQRTAMKANFSWDIPTQHYLSLYREVAKTTQQAKL